MDKRTQPERVLQLKPLTMTKHDQLAEAIEAGDVAKVGQILGEHPELVNSPEWTPPPLHCAVLWDQPQVAEVLLQHGADIEIRDPDRQTTPLRYAIMYCKPDLIRLFVSQGAEAGAIVENGTTALQLAIEAASGAYEELDDLPSRDDYQEIAELLKNLCIQ